MTSTDGVPDLPAIGPVSAPEPSGTVPASGSKPASPTAPVSATGRASQVRRAVAPEPADGSGRVTVGVVIDLPDPHATVIDRWRTRSGDSQAGRIAPHITLLPPTKVEATELDGVMEHLGKVAAANAAFPLDLNGTDSFRPVSQVAFVRVAEGTRQCADLEAAVRSGPLGHPREYPYRPHVTVAHDVDDPALDEACAGLSDFVARFPVDRFSLYLLSRGSWTFACDFHLPLHPVDGAADGAAGDTFDDEPAASSTIDPTNSC